MEIPELAYAHELPEQFEKIGQGAQFAVYMLTNPRLSQPETPDRLYETPRVIKQTIGRSAIAAYVQEHIGITDPVDVQTKVTELELASMRTLWPVMHTAWNPAVTVQLMRSLGRPTFVMPDPTLFNLDDIQVGIGYTQNYVQPVARLLPKLNFRRPSHRELAYDLVDQYVSLEQLLIRHGMFDVDFKLTDNCGVTEKGDLVLIDFSELTFARSAVEKVMREATWRQLPQRREYTQLPPKLQAYLGQQLSRRITDRHLHNWGSEKPDNDALYHDLTAKYHMHDIAGQKLWWQRPGRKHAQATLLQQIAARQRATHLSETPPETGVES